MNTIILFFFFLISSYTIKRLREDLTNYAHVGNWSVWEHDKAHKGDRFFMVRCGEGKTGICMSGRFRSEPYKGEDWTGKGREVYYMDLMADTVIDPDILPILSTELLSQKIPSFDWRGGHSGRVLPVEEAEKLEKLWVDFLEENDPMFGTLTLKSDISDEDIMDVGDDYEPYCASIEITEDGEFEIHSAADDVEVVSDDLETVKKEFAKKMKETGNTIPIEFNVWKVHNQELFQKAWDVAKEAYCGIKDEYGQPYIKRALKETEDSFSDVDILVCLLHYVLKNPKFTTDTLIQKGIPKVVVDAVEVLHQKESENFEQYLQRVGQNQQVSRILYEIVERRLYIKELPELSLDRFAGLAQDLKAYHYLDEMRRRRRRAVFHGPAKDFDMWLDLYGYANPIAICGEYNDDEVAEIARALKYNIGWRLDISELNVGRWAKDNPHEATYEEEILWKLGEDGGVNFLEKMMLNRKYGTIFKKWGSVVTCDNGRVLVHIPEDFDFVDDSDIEIIGRCAAAGNETIESLELPANVRIIDDYAFAYCKKLRNVFMPDSIESIGEFSFENCEIENLRLSNSLTAIPDCAFLFNEIEHIDIPQNIRRIGSCAFEGNILDEELIIPEGVEIIESASFCCTAIKKVSLPSTLTEIAYDFYFEEMIDAPEEDKPYVEIHPDNPVYFSKGGTLYSRATGKEVLGRAGREHSEQN